MPWMRPPAEADARFWYWCEEPSDAGLPPDLARLDGGRLVTGLWVATPDDLRYVLAVWDAAAARQPTTHVLPEVGLFLVVDPSSSPATTGNDDDSNGGSDVVVDCQLQRGLHLAPPMARWGGLEAALLGGRRPLLAQAARTARMLSLLPANVFRTDPVLGPWLQTQPIWQAVREVPSSSSSSKRRRP